MATNNIHILIIPSWYPTPKNPINGIFFLEQAQALQKAGYRVNVLVPPDLKSLRLLKKIQSTSDLNQKISIEIYQGLKTYRASAWNWFPRPKHCFNKYLVRLYGLQFFESYLRNEGKPDIIHAHSIFYGGSLATQLGQKWQIPVVLTEHSSALIMQEITTAKSNVIKETLPRIDKVLTVGKPLADVLSPYQPQSPIVILGNSIDVEHFHRLKEEIPQEPFTFSMVAFLTKNKGGDKLILAFSQAFKDSKVNLNIGGDGKEREELEQLVSNLKIENQVNFLGMLSRQEVCHLFQNSHAVISSSYVETFGVNLIEAMACGKPVIATRSGGPEMFVNNTNGILVPPGDVDALAEAMQTMVETYDHYDPEQIRAECVSRFSEAAIIRQLEKIYQDAIKTNAN